VSLRQVRYCWRIQSQPRKPFIFSRVKRISSLFGEFANSIWLSAIGIAPDLVIPHSPQLPPKRPDFIFPDRPVGAEQHRGEELRNVSTLRSFPMRASFSRSEYYDRTDSSDRHGGVLHLAFCRKPPSRIVAHSKTNSLVIDLCLALISSASIVPRGSTVNL